MKQKYEKLILFDIDGTLIEDKNPAHRGAFIEAFRKTYYTDTNIDVINPTGMTDQQIILEVLKQHGFDEKTVIAKLPDAMYVMVSYFEKNNDSSGIVVLDGVNELLGELKHLDYLIGLITGNLEQIARGKMEAVDLNTYFKLGGFGSDDMYRENLVRLAIKRAEEKYNFVFENNVFVFGDSPRDIEAAHDAHTIAVGVATSKYSVSELEKAGADQVFDSLVDTNAVLNYIHEG